jgi:hypothetical protein
MRSTTFLVSSSRNHGTIGSQYKRADFLVFFRPELGHHKSCFGDISNGSDVHRRDLAPKSLCRTVGCCCVQKRLYGPQRPLTETTPVGVWAGTFRIAAPREAPVFGKHPRRALGCQRVGKTLAVYGVKARCCGKEIETVAVGVAGDDSRGATRNFDYIRVGHEGFLPLASVKSIYS